MEMEVKDIDICNKYNPDYDSDAKVISKMPTHTLIIDLASKPGGTDFGMQKSVELKALLAPGLPGIVAPKTAGKIIANVLSQLLKEDFDRRGEYNMNLKGKRIGFGLTGRIVRMMQCIQKSKSYQ